MGGIEKWLIQLLRNIDPKVCSMDFILQSADGPLNEEAEKLGARLHFVREVGGVAGYGVDLYKRFRRERFDIVHSHLHHFSGYVLRIAKLADIDTRVAHVHNDLRHVHRSVGLGRKLYLRQMKRWVQSFATHGLAASRDAAEDLFGPQWRSDPRWSVLHCGIDLSPFAHAATSDPRGQLGLDPSAFVIVHVGRFTKQKNHSFIVDVFERVSKQNSDAYLVLIGDGPLRPEIERRVKKAKLENCVVFLGIRDDVPALLRGAADLFLFPSLHEGLGLAVIEAQAAGVPSMVSTSVPAEADLGVGLVHWELLTSGVEGWARRIGELQHTPRPLKRSKALEAVERSSYNISASAKALVEFYRHACGVS